MTTSTHEPGSAESLPPLELGEWDLTSLLPDTDSRTLDQAFADLEERVVSFVAWRERLDEATSGETLLEILRAYESLLERAYELSAYGSLWFSADTQSSAALTYRNRMQQILTGVENRILFFRLWWMDQEEATAARLLEELEAAGGSRDQLFFLEELRRLRAYKLDEKSEQIINLKDADGIGAVMTLYSMITNKLEYRPDIDREDDGPLTRDALMAYAYSDNPQHREAAYNELYRVYGENSGVLSQMYSNRVRDWHNENVDLRGYASPISVRNVANDVPDEAIDALLSVVRERSELFQRWFCLKAQWLGKEQLGGGDRLRRCDIYAPLAVSERRIEYKTAAEQVLDVFSGFHPEMGRHARRVFAERHIDSEPRPGKRGGAFCATVTPKHTPWVLVNYTGKLRDVATLAHEMGHAVHSMLAEEHSLLTQHPSLPLAETASVFAEILMTDRLLAEEHNPLARRELLASAVDDVYATVLRQTYFVLFEIEAHRAILEGASQEELERLYLENLKQQFGDAVDIPEIFRHEWISIPHIYSTPFYCYAYSFGQLLVLALYRRYQEEGEAFKPGYLELLAYGGSERPEVVLSRAGVEIKDPVFWRGGFEVVEEMIRQLEDLQES